MAEQSLKEKTAKGLFWGGLSNGVQQLLNLFFGIFLSRILNGRLWHGGNAVHLLPYCRLFAGKRVHGRPSQQTEYLPQRL